jgi:hypothetical protein
MDLNFQDVLKLLAPGTGQNLIWSIMLYILFFLALLTLFKVPDKNMVPTLIMGTVLLFIIVAKLSISANAVRGGRPIINNKDFGMYIINIAIGVLPLIAIGMTRVTSRVNRRSNPATGPAILTAVVGIVYFFGFWLAVQQMG